ncbi:MAG: archease [Planctomycetota bacterium]
MEARFELFDHTADVGIRVFAPSMAGLIAPAGEGLYTVIGELAPGGDRSRLRLEHTGDDPAVLLRDYLAELLFQFEDQQRIVVSTDVRTFDEGRLVVEAQLATVDESVSLYEREVKAITYHALEIAKLEDGFQATIIVDI